MSYKRYMVIVKIKDQQISYFLTPSVILLILLQLSGMEESNGVSINGIAILVSTDFG